MRSGISVMGCLLSLTCHRGTDTSGFVFFTYDVSDLETLVEVSPFERDDVEVTGFLCWQDDLEYHGCDDRKCCHKTPTLS